MIGYRILYVDEAETQPKLNVSVGANISSIELTGLLVYTNYCIQVLVFNSQQDGNASDCLFSLTDEDGKNKKSAEDSFVREAIYTGKILNYRESKCVSTAQYDLKKKEQDKNPWQDYERLSNTEEHQLSVSAFNVEPQLGLNRSRFQKCLILF